MSLNLECVLAAVSDEIMLFRSIFGNFLVLENYESDVDVQYFAFMVVG